MEPLGEERGQHLLLADAPAVGGLPRGQGTGIMVWPPPDILQAWSCGSNSGTSRAPYRLHV